MRGYDTPLEGSTRRCRSGLGYRARRGGRPPVGNGGGPIVRRRELVAGVGSLGVLTGGGAVVWRGGFGGSGTADSAAADDDEPTGPIAVEPVNAAEIGTQSVTVPAEGADATVITFFSTNCAPCHEEIGNVAAVRTELADDYGDSLRFVSVPFESPDVVSAAELREWWDTYGGDWPVGFDPEYRLRDRYSPLGMPTTTVLDGDGTKHWMNTGPHQEDKLVDEIRPVLESAGSTA